MYVSDMSLCSEVIERSIQVLVCTSIKILL